MGKINVYNKIVMKNKKMRKYGNQKKCRHKSSSKRKFWNGIYTWLRLADARGSADTIYCM